MEVDEYKKRERYVWYAILFLCFITKFTFEMMNHREKVSYKMLHGLYDDPRMTYVDSAQDWDDLKTKLQVVCEQEPSRCEVW